MERKDIRVKIRPDRVPASDALIINIPVILFFALATLSLAFVLRVPYPFKVVPFILAWWSLSGGILLYLDYIKRKREIYLRLRRMPPEPGSGFARSLGQTLCGWALYRAAYRYARENRA